MPNAPLIFEHRGWTISCEVVESPHRRTLSIHLQPPARVVVRVPSRTSQAQVRKLVTEKADWIVRHLERWRDLPPVVEPRFESGAPHRFLGEDLELKFVPGSPEGVRRQGSRLLVVSRDIPDAKKIHRLLVAWEREEAEKLFPEIARRLFPPFAALKYKFPEIRVRQLRSRWGSLSARNLMLLNLDLIHAPMRAIEYIVLHELCHLVHQHHRAEFYGLVASHMPDWKERRALLDRTEGGLVPRPPSDNPTRE
jgi:predicted metal-dependent hydrolase